MTLLTLILAHRELFSEPLSLSLSSFLKLTAVAQSTDLSVGGSPPESPAPGTCCRLPDARGSPEDPGLAGGGDRTLADVRGGGDLAASDWRARKGEKAEFCDTKLQALTPSTTTMEASASYAGGHPQQAEQQDASSLFHHHHQFMPFKQNTVPPSP